MFVMNFIITGSVEQVGYVYAGFQRRKLRRMNGLSNLFYIFAVIKPV